jgi:Polyketide cyclase / dehydrase and lipid transport
MACCAKAVQSFAFEYRIACPPAVVFAELADPAYIARIAPFEVTVTHVRDGRDHRNGVGSIRRIKPWFAPAYEEEIIVFVPDRLMEYRTVSGTPFDHHRGSYRIEPDGDGTRFWFHLEFSTRVPGLARLIKWPLEPMNRRGFDNLVRQLEAR